MYEECAKKIVDEVLEGYSGKNINFMHKKGTIMCYG